MRTLSCVCAAAIALFACADQTAAMAPQAPAPAGKEPAPAPKGDPGSKPGSKPGSEPAADKAQPPAWVTDYDDALARGKKEKKLVLVSFTETGCEGCAALKNEVFSKPAFQQWAAKNVVLLEIDFPREGKLPPKLKEQNEKVRDKHKVKEMPTVLFLDAKGKKLGQLGYGGQSPEEWVKLADELVAKKK